MHRTKGIGEKTPSREMRGTGASADELIVALQDTVHSTD